MCSWYGQQFSKECHGKAWSRTDWTLALYYAMVARTCGFWRDAHRERKGKHHTADIGTQAATATAIRTFFENVEGEMARWTSSAGVECGASALTARAGLRVSCNETMCIGDVGLGSPAPPANFLCHVLVVSSRQGRLLRVTYFHCTGLIVASRFKTRAKQHIQCPQPPMPCSDLTKTRRNSVPSSVVHILLMRVNSDFCCFCSDSFNLLATKLISQESG